MLLGSETSEVPWGHPGDKCWGLVQGLLHPKPNTSHSQKKQKSPITCLLSPASPDPGPPRHTGLCGTTPAQQQEHPWATSPLCHDPGVLGGLVMSMPGVVPGMVGGRCCSIQSHGQTSQPCPATWGGSSGYSPSHPAPQNQHESKLKVSFACRPVQWHQEGLFGGALQRS